MVKYFYNVPSELVSKKIFLFFSKFVFHEPPNMTGVCGYVEKRRVMQQRVPAITSGR